MFDIHGSIHLGYKGFIEIPTRCILFTSSWNFNKTFLNMFISTFTNFHDSCCKTRFRPPPQKVPHILYSHLSSLDNLMMSYIQGRNMWLHIIYNCVSWLYVYIDIYTQLCIIDTASLYTSSSIQAASHMAHIYVKACVIQPSAEVNKI